MSWGMDGSRMPTYKEALEYCCAAVLYQNIDLNGPWQGWKIRGQYLVSPQRDRIMVRELVGALLHYRAKFGHMAHKRKKADQALPSNVVPFAQAAQDRLTAKKRAQDLREAGRVQGGALRAP